MCLSAQAAALAQSIPGIEGSSAAHASPPNMPTILQHMHPQNQLPRFSGEMAVNHVMANTIESCGSNLYGCDKAYTQPQVWMHQTSGSGCWRAKPKSWIFVLQPTTKIYPTCSPEAYHLNAIWISWEPPSLSPVAFEAGVVWTLLWITSSLHGDGCGEEAPNIKIACLRLPLPLTLLGLGDSSCIQEDSGCHKVHFGTLDKMLLSLYGVPLGWFGVDFQMFLL